MRLDEAFPYGSRVAVAWTALDPETPATFVSKVLPADDGVLLVEPPLSGEAPPLMVEVQMVREDGAHAIVCSARFVGEDEEGWLNFKVTGEAERHAKRRFFRVVATLPVSLPDVKLAQTVDISGSGLLLETPGAFPYEPGDIVDAVLCLPAGVVPVTLRVVRRRITPVGTLVGMDFHRITDDDRELVIAFTVEQQRGKVRTG